MAGRRTASLPVRRSIRTSEGKLGVALEISITATELGCSVRPFRSKSLKARVFGRHLQRGWPYYFPRPVKSVYLGSVGHRLCRQRRGAMGMRMSPVSWVRTGAQNLRARALKAEAR